MKAETKKTVTAYIIGIAIPLATGALSALFTSGSMDIYGDLNLPPLAPPSWLFPIAWMVLYTLMGISSAMVYLKKDVNPEAATKGLTYYAVSLIVNFCWSIVFFNMRAFLIAFVILLVLIYLIVRTVIYYHKVCPVSSYLQIPYLAWVVFAGYLNIMIYLLNQAM